MNSCFSVFVYVCNVYVHGHYAYIFPAAMSMYMVTMPMYPCHCAYVHGLYVWGGQNLSMYMFFFFTIPLGYLH